VNLFRRIAHAAHVLFGHRSYDAASGGNRWPQWASMWAKATGQINEGAIVWWDATTGHNVVNAGAIGLFPIGVAVRAAGSSDTTARVRLSGFLRRRWPDG
jgi:hypothetical protein